MATAAAVLLSINGSAAATTEPRDQPDPLDLMAGALPIVGPLLRGLIPRAAEPCLPASAAPAEPTIAQRASRRLAVPAPGAVVLAPPPAPGTDTPPDGSTAQDDCVPPATGTPVTPAPAASPPGRSISGKPGARGVGDAYFPSAGNGGYDVRNYDVTLGYNPKGRRIDATVVISAQATQDLSSFSLDYRGPRVLGVAVNGQSATYRRQGQELTIAPPETLPRGQAFTAVVQYAGEPGPIRTSSLGTYGWVPTRDGAITVSEPDGTPTWLPVNDHPRDKATYVFRITVPKSLQVLANGTPAAPVRNGATTTYTWTEQSPMASYLAMVAIGKFQVLRGKAGNLPVITAVDPKFGKSAKALQRTTITALKWETKTFGPYPFATGGGIIDDPQLDYALETQERPVYAGFTPDDDFIVHELAHQWFGNSVSLRRWPDIWLNEGFATYAEWLWQEHRTRGAKKKNRDTAAKIFKRYYQQPANSAIFNPPPARPGRRDLFGFSVYIRGAMCLQALRQRVGDKAFFRTLRAWTAQRRHGSAITTDFVALAEKQSGKRLGKLFHAWLYAKGKPKKW